MVDREEFVAHWPHRATVPIVVCLLKPTGGVRLGEGKCETFQRSAGRRHDLTPVYNAWRCFRLARNARSWKIWTQTGRDLENAD